MAFVAGWVVGLAVVVTAVTLLVGEASSSDAQATDDGVGWGKLVLGVLLLVLAVRRWRSRPTGDDEPVPPRWMAGLDEVGPGKAAGLGAALVAINPKNLALAVAGAAAVGAAQPGGGAEALALVVLVVVASIGVAVPVAVALTAGERLDERLEAARAWLVANNATVVAVVLVPS